MNILLEDFTFFIICHLNMILLNQESVSDNDLIYAKIKFKSI